MNKVCIMFLFIFCVETSCRNILVILGFSEVENFQSFYGKAFYVQTINNCFQNLRRKNGGRRKCVVEGCHYKYDRFIEKENMPKHLIKVPKV